MKKTTRITLIRHGETVWNRLAKLQGSQDIPLSDVGLHQAAGVAKRLRKEAQEDQAFHRVYSSNLQRAHQTAKTISDELELPHHVHDDLKERSYGELEGMTREEILQRYPNFWEPGARHDEVGVEAFADLCERALRAVTHIADQHPGEHLVLVSHGGTINAFLHRISEGQYGSGQNKLGNTSISRVVRHEDGTWTIESVGDVAHLE